VFETLFSLCEEDFHPVAMLSPFLFFFLLSQFSFHFLKLQVPAAMCLAPSSVHEIVQIVRNPVQSLYYVSLNLKTSFVFCFSPVNGRESKTGRKE
jgi:hypothetical protein